MARPRILLVPTLTELEWRIKSTLEEWAEVASYDAPGIGQESPYEGPLPMATVARGLAELERRGWNRCIVVGDEYGTYGAARIAVERPEAVEGLALGHACLSFSEEGDRAAVSGDVMGAMRKLFVVDYRAYARHLTQVTKGAYDEETASEYIERVPHEVARGYQSEIRGAGESLEALIKSVSVPLLLAKHDGCLAWTDQGWEDAVAAFPDAETVITEQKPSCSQEFADSLRQFCSKLASVRA